MWAISGSHILTITFTEWWDFIAYDVRPKWRPRLPDVEWFQTRILYYDGAELVPVVIAFALARSLARPTCDLAPDGREWAGRAFLAALVLWWLFSRALIMIEQ